MTARKARFKSILLSSVFLLCLSSARDAFSHPLRIWVMPNEQAADISRVNATEIKEYLDALRAEEGIVIENTIQDLIQAGSIDNNLPIGGYVIGTNQLAKEISRFKTETGFQGQVLIKLIRWNDAFNALLAAKYSLPDEQMPDIVQIGSTWTASFVHIDALENLDGLIKENDFYPASIESARPVGMGGLYAVPWFIDTRLMFYWKDKLNGDALKNWQSLKEACPEVIKNNPQLKGVIGFPMAMTWNLLHNIAPWLWAGGGDILEDRYAGPVPAHRVLLDSPRSIESILYLRDLSAGRCALMEDISAESMDTRFLNGEIASLITLPAFRNRLPKGWEEKIGITLPPAGPEGSYPFVGGSHLAIWSGAKRRGNFDAALSLIKYLSSPPSQKRYSEIVDFPPANKETLKEFGNTPYMDVYNDALLRGRSYPSIAEWGLVVENEFVRSHLWNIWQAIAQGQPDAIIVSTVKNASDALRKKIVLTALDKGRWYALSLVGSIIGFGGLIAARSRRRRGMLEAGLEKTSKKLVDIEGQRTLLAGQLLMLERKDRQQSAKIDGLREELKQLNENSTALSKELSQMRDKQREESRQRIGDVRVSWDGRLFFDGTEVCFENSKQAHRLIEHILRGMVYGSTSVSCLWGYALFGWDTQKLHSWPNRLFNTAVAKINGAISGRGRPIFLKSEGRKSWRWRCLWNAETLLKNSDISSAQDEVARAREASAAGHVELAFECIKKALETDPKCIDAVNLASTLSPGIRSKLNGLLVKFRQEIMDGVDELDHAAKAVGFLLDRGLEMDEYRELMEHERSTMKHLANHLRKCVEGISVKVTFEKQPLHLADILRRLSSVQLEISSIRASGVAEKGVWATIVHSENFTGLLSVPRMQALVNRFYNHETKMVEDPRLVQLALVLMISKPEYIERLEKAKTDEEFFAVLERQLQKQFRALEQQISLLSPH